MELTTSQRLYFLVAILLVGFLANYTQQFFLLNWDVTWLTRAASYLLKGGTYSNDFFEIAPPTNIMLYTPAMLISKLFSLSAVAALRTYVFTLGCISLTSCYPLVSKIFKDSKLGLTFIIALEIAYFILPLNDFGQKEHLFFILIMPYILLMVCRAQNSQINPYMATWIGFLAGLGIAMKPFFLIFPLLLELYNFSIIRNSPTSLPNKWLRFTRPETCIIFCIFLTYAIITFIFFRDYLTVVVPYALRWNYASMSEPFDMLYKKIIIWYSLIPCLVFVIQYKNQPYKHLSSVLVIAIFSSILSYFLQRTTFSYHIYPIIALDWILSVLLLSVYVSNGNNTKLQYFLTYLLIAAVPICFPFFFTLILSYSILLPSLFFSFFVFALLFTLYFSSTNKFKIVIATSILVCVGLIIRHVSITTDSYTVYAILFFLACVFTLCSRHTNISMNHFLTSSALVIVLLAGIFVNQTITAWTTFANDNQFRNLFAFTDQHAAHKSIYFLTTGPEYSNVINYCKNTKSAMRLEFFWMLPAMIKQADISMPYQKDKDFLINMITEDLRNKKPYLVYVDISEHKPFLYSHQNKNWYQFDFLPFLLQTPVFQKEWEKYHYTTTIELGNKRSKSTRKFNVYQRNV